jgi:hypothetical protein
MRDSLRITNGGAGGSKSATRELQMKNCMALQHLQVRAGYSFFSNYYN